MLLWRDHLSGSSYNPGEITAFNSFVSEVAPIRQSNCLVLDGVKSISITLRIERVKRGIDLSGPTVQSVENLVGTLTPGCA